MEDFEPSASRENTLKEKPFVLKGIDLSLFITIAVFAIGIIRLVTFANFDPKLIQILAENLNIGQVLLGSLSFLPLVICVAAIIEGEYLHSKIIRRILKTAFFISLFFYPINAIWWFSLVMYVFWKGYRKTIARRSYYLSVDLSDVGLIERKIEKVLAFLDKVVTKIDNFMTWMFSLLFVTLIALTVLSVSTAEFWIPAEKIEFENKTIEGYIVSTEPEGWTTIIEVFTKDIYREKSSEIKSRVVCDQRDNSFLGKRNDIPSLILYNAVFANSESPFSDKEKFSC